MSFAVGDIVTRTTGERKPAEVRALFTSKRGKPMLVVEYEREVFRVLREKQAEPFQQEQES